MKISVLSGKGGAGKTFVSVNLAAAFKEATYIDCDVEEPNGRLFLKPEQVSEIPVYAVVPKFDAEKCIGCRKCVDFCRFNALIFIKEKPLVFNEVCHACGGCEIVCPKNAISEMKRPVGHIEQGIHNGFKVITGVLNTGEASGIPVIKKAQEIGFLNSKNVIIDCPPGSACSVMESVSESDFCILVAEPTSFGFHNFCMVYELVSLLKKPCGVVINKEDSEYKPLYDFCKENNIPILAKIPYSQETASLSAKGEIISEKDKNFEKLFLDIIKKIGGASL